MVHITTLNILKQLTF